MSRLFIRLEGPHLHDRKCESDGFRGFNIGGLLPAGSFDTKLVGVGEEEGGGQFSSSDAAASRAVQRAIICLISSGPRHSHAAIEKASSS